MFGSYYADMQPAPVLITGATGFIGSYLFRHLEEAGIPVRGVSRTVTAGTHALRDIASGETDWSPILSGVGTVVHCAAIAGESLKGERAGVQNDRLYSVNRDAVVKLAQSCVENGVQRFIFLSTVKIYGENSTPGAPFFESDAANPANDYAKSKRQAEELLQPFREQGLDVCILRLPLVYGPALKGNLRMLHRLLEWRIPLPFRGVQNRRSLLGLNNLAAVIEGLLTLESWRFSVLNVADPQPVSTPQLIEILGSVVPGTPRLLPFPFIMMRPFARLLRLDAILDRLVGSLEVHCADLASVLPEVRLMPTKDALPLLLAQGAMCSSDDPADKNTL